MLQRVISEIVNKKIACQSILRKSHVKRDLINSRTYLSVTNFLTVTALTDQDAKYLLPTLRDKSHASVPRTTTARSPSHRRVELIFPL